MVSNGEKLPRFSREPKRGIIDKVFDTTVGLATISLLQLGTGINALNTEYDFLPVPTQTNEFIGGFLVLAGLFSGTQATKKFLGGRKSESQISHFNSMKEYEDAKELAELSGQELPFSVVIQRTIGVDEHLYDFHQTYVGIKDPDGNTIWDKIVTNNIAGVETIAAPFYEGRARRAKRKAEKIARRVARKQR